MTYALATYFAVATLSLLAIISIPSLGGEIESATLPTMFSTMRIHGAVTAALVGLALVVRRRRTCGSAWPRITLLGSIALAACSVDRLVGVAYPPPPDSPSILQPHPRRGWSYRANMRGVDGGALVSTNQYGLRGPRFAHSKPEGEFRILFLGDSVTFGYSLEEERTFVRGVESRLARERSSPTVRCINAGVCGYATWQELDLLEEVGMGLDPDLLVLQFCMNDVSDMILRGPGRISGGELRFDFSTPSHFSGIVRAIRSIRLQREWRRSMQALQWSPPDANEPDDEPPQEFGDLFRLPLRPRMAAAWEQALEDLDRFDAFCRKRDLPYVLVVFPFRSQISAGASGPVPQARLHDWARLRGVEHCLDLLPALRKRARAAQDETLYFDVFHQTPAGSALVARTIAEYLSDGGLIR